MFRRTPGHAGLPIALGFLLGVASLGVAEAARAEGEDGRLSLRPSLRITAAFDDNLFSEENGEEAAFGTWVRPRVEAAWRQRGFEAGVDLAADVRRYPDHSTASEELWEMSGFAEVALLPGLRLRVHDAFVPQPRALGRPHDDATNLLQTNRLEAQIAYWTVLPDGRELEIGLSGTHFLSESFVAQRENDAGSVVVDDHFHADFWQGASYVEVQSPVGAYTAAYVRGEVRYRGFDEASTADFLDVTTALGLRGTVWRRLDFELSGGFGFVSFDELSSEQRALGSGTLRWRLPRGWTLRAGATHATTADLLGRQVLESSARFGVEKRIDERTRASVGLFGSRFDRDVWSGGADLYGAAEVRIRRRLWNHAELIAGYRFWGNAGPRGLDDFRQNRVTLALSYRR